MDLPRKQQPTGTKRNKAFLADELLPIFKKLPQVIEVTSHRYLFFLNGYSGTLGKIAVLEVPGDMNRISQALLFLFLALSALISHVENSAHCERMFLWSLSLYYGRGSLRYNITRLTEEGIGLGTDREL
ncbi:hypothetical protein ACJX0J_004412 (mitochondrion) [Zea mays]